MAVTVLKETEAGESITVNAEPDLDGIRSTIQTFVQRYNEVTAFIREQSSYDNETKTAGALYGDFTLTTADRSLSNALGSRISGIESNYNQLFSIGIRSTLDGRLAITDNSRLDKALRENLDDVIKLFTSSGSSTSTGIEYISSSSKTRTTTDVAVNVTRAASQGFLTSTTLTKPETTPIVLTNANNRLRLTIDGLVSDEIILTNGTYATSDELIDELQTKINEDAKIGARGVKVEWLPGGATTGTIRVSSSSYGSASKVGIVASIPSSAYAQLGLAAAISSDGVDVAGTLNGEAAEGKGQTLTGKKGNKTTEGLSVKVGLADELVTDDVEGSLTLSRGIASRIESVVTNLTLSKDGVLDRKIKGYQGQIDDLTERIEQYNLRIQIRRQSLFEKFFAMEEAVGQLNSQGAFLSAQLSGLSASLSSIGSRTTTSGRQRRT